MNDHSFQMRTDHRRRDQSKRNYHARFNVYSNTNRYSYVGKKYAIKKRKSNLAKNIPVEKYLRKRRDHSKL